jgi:NADH-quinone oxidoreductase subunit A
MEHLVPPILPVFLLVVCVIGLAVGLLILARIVRPGHPGRVTRMPYESGMDPIHDTRRRFDVRFYLLAIAFLVFDVELLFLYPWAVASGQLAVGGRQSAAEVRRGGEGEKGRRGDEKTTSHQSSPPLSLSPSPPLLDPASRNTDAPAAAEKHHLMFAGAMTFVALLALGFVYDWRKGVFQWR